MSRPVAAVAAVRGAVRAALADVSAGALVLVACSGGPDSLALAAGLAFVGPRAGVRAGAVVVDHGLQAASDEVATRAAAACRALGLDPVVVRRVSVGRAGGGPEARAREARYAALATAADEMGAAAVLLGHTRDDQAETVLLGLARGSGARSLAGMPPVRGAFRRPLLGITRAQTWAACRALGLEPWHDPTNTAGPNLRSRVRHEVMPLLEEVLGPGVAAALARTADLAREQADVVDALAAELVARATVPGDRGPRGDESGSGGPPAGRSVGAGAPCGAGARDEVWSDGVEDVSGDEWSQLTRSRGVSASDDSTSRQGAPLAGHEAPPARRMAPLDVGVLAGAPEGVRRAALRAAALRAGATPGALARTHVLALDALVVGWHGQGPVPLPGGVEGVRRYGRLFLQHVTTRP